MITKKFIEKYFVGLENLVNIDYPKKGFKFEYNYMTVELINISKDTCLVNKQKDWDRNGYSVHLHSTDDILKYFEIQKNYIPLFSRDWEMPNSNTFDIKCINRLIHKYLKSDMISIDPFANKNKIAKITNDLNTEYDTDYHLDALDFLKQFEDNSTDFVLYDPPYSPRQVSECYKKLGKTVNMQTTQASFWGNLKNEISRVTKPNGYVISFGWNSNGIGKTKGFELVEILLVSHGGSHNDTICTVERKR